METPTAEASARCAACGAELTDAAAGWCSRCGEALVLAGDGWDVAFAASERGTRNPDQTTGLAGDDASSSASRHIHDGSSRRFGWRARPAWLKSRRAVLALAAAVVVVLAGAATGGTLAIRAAMADARTLFPVTIVDQSGVTKLGYIDKSGTMIIKPGEFSGVWGSSSDIPPSSFSEGLAPVSVGGKVGFIDTKGRMVIEPRYSGADSFHDGLALVWPENSDGADCAYIDKRGAYVVSPGQYFEGHAFSEGLAAVKVTLGDQVGYGYIDRTGALVIQPQFEQVGEFSEGLAPAEVLDHYRPVWGYIDKTGKWVIEPQFDFALGFSEGFAAVMTNGASINGVQWGYIDKVGLWLVHPIFADARGFSEGLACVREADATGSGLCGFIDRSGAWAILPRYLQANDFSQGVAAAMLPSEQDLWGYIDHKGEWAIEPKFSMASDFAPPGLAMVWLAPTSTAVTPATDTTVTFGGFGLEERLPIGSGSEPISAYINKTGKIVWQSRPSGGSSTSTDSTATTTTTTTTSPTPVRPAPTLNIYD